MDIRNYSDISSFILDGCPVKPDPDEVFYIEAEYDEEVNALIRENFAFIKDCLWTSGQKTFFYLPSITPELLEECIKYHAPGLKRDDMDMPSFSISSLLDYLYDPQQRENFKPGFARNNKSSMYLDGFGKDCAEFTLFHFDTEKCKTDPKEYLTSFCKRLCDDTVVCHLGSVSLELVDYQIAEYGFGLDEEGQELTRQIKELARRLYAKGVGEYYIKQLVGSQPVLSRLVVTKDYKILLPDFNNMEIAMEPMNKAVYLLFLRHPEGIAFKDMIDYKQELLKIYLRLWANKDYAKIDWERIDKAIDNICSPLSNSINEKTSRIKSIFLKEMHDDVARNYYITGRYGGPRKIILQQEMIEWQTPDIFNNIEKSNSVPSSDSSLLGGNVPF